MSKKPVPFPRLAGRLYFFPALLPLAEIAPWLLAMLGAVTGAAGFTAACKRHSGKIKIITALCFIAAMTVYIAERPSEAVRNNGTAMTPAIKLPVAEIKTAATTPTTTVAKKFGELWTKVTPKQVLSLPVIAGDKILFGSYQGTVEALSLKSGDPLWSLPQSAYVFSLGLSDDGVIYAGTGLHDNNASTLTALMPDDGKVLWQREFLGHLENAPAIDTAHHRLWLGTGPGGLWSLDTKDGHVLWHNAAGHIDSTPLLLDNTIYVPAQPAKQSFLYALDAGTGTEKWRTPLPGQPWGSPLASPDGRIVFVSSGIGQIGVNKATDRGWTQAIRIADGEVIWRQQLPSMAIQPDVYVPEAGIIIYAIKDGTLLALNTKDGSTAWTAKVGGEFQTGITRLAGNNEPLIAATTYDGVFSIRRARTGDELARRAVGKNGSSAPVSIGDTVYVTTAYGITAFGGVSSLRGPD